MLMPLTDCALQQQAMQARNDQSAALTTLLFDAVHEQVCGAYRTSTSSHHSQRSAETRGSYVLKRVSHAVKLRLC
jgi:hypothetical protein